MFGLIIYPETYVERMIRTRTYAAMTVENTVDKKIVFGKDGKTKSMEGVDGHGNSSVNIKA